MSKIEWTERTWNPIVGCSIVSPGCIHCYATPMAARIERMASANGAKTTPYAGTTRIVLGRAVWTGRLALAERKLLEPLQRKQPTTYFVNSMGDMFHESVPDEWIDKVFATMALAPQHTFQVLTKRSMRMWKYFGGTHRGRWASVVTKLIAEGHVKSDRSITAAVAAMWEAPALPNVWLGVSTEDQRRADERIPDLLATPAAVRFISAEPLLGPLDVGAGLNALVESVDFPGYPAWTRGLLPSLDWVIVGGESGHRARPMHPDWVRSMRDQCAGGGVPFFFKQWGEVASGRSASARLRQDSRRHSGQAGPDEAAPRRHAREKAPEHAFAERGVPAGVLDDGRLTFRVGKARAGRLLDGVIHDALPERAR